MREADLGNGMDTVRPVKRVDAAGSMRLSNEFLGKRTLSNGEIFSTSPVATTSSAQHKRAASEAGRAGRAILGEIVLPTLQNAIRDDMDARDIEALSMVSKGFIDLKESNPELAYNVIMDILSGINDNDAVRSHISTHKGLFPHKRVRRATQVTASGVVVVEEVADDEPAAISPTSPHAKQSSSASHKSDEPKAKSPISELLYLRWLEGLRLKWPSLYS